MTYSHSYVDPDTGDIIDVMDEDDDDVIDHYRNAGPGDGRRGRGFGRIRDYTQGGVARRRRPEHRPRPSQRPVIVHKPRPAPAPPPPVQDGFFTVDKGMVADVVPAVGKVWASFLVPPDGPQATGDDIVDRDNASMHRQALAAHQQNQTRILALSDLAARVLKMVV